MKPTQLPIVLAFASLAACAAHKEHGSVARLNSHASAHGAGAVGTFRAELFPSLTTEEHYLTIGDQSVTVGKVCKNVKDSIKVEVTAPARVSASHFDVPAAAQKSVPFAGGECVAKIEAGVVAFEVKSDDLVLTPENGTAYTYGHRADVPASERLEHAKQATHDAATATKEGLAQAATGVKDTAVNGARVVKAETAQAAAAIRDAAARDAARAQEATAREAAAIRNAATAAKEGVVKGATVVKEKTINGATAVKETTINAATAVKEGTINTATAVKDGTIKGATAVKEGVINGATAVKDTVVNVATGAKDAVVNDTTRFKENTINEATAIKNGVVNVATGAKDLVFAGFDRLRLMFGRTLDKAGNGLKKAGAEVKPEDAR